MNDQQRIEVLELQVKILSTFVHAMMSLAPIQADKFESQMREAAHKPCPHAVVCIHPCDVDECFLETIEQPNGPTRQESLREVGYPISGQ